MNYDIDTTLALNSDFVLHTFFVVENTRLELRACNCLQLSQFNVSKIFESSLAVMLY